jgi:hypothetical protein
MGTCTLLQISDRFNSIEFNHQIFFLLHLSHSASSHFHFQNPI